MDTLPGQKVHVVACAATLLIVQQCVGKKSKMVVSGKFLSNDR